jgi:hypothetical protein
MEPDLPMMEISAAFSRVLEGAAKKLHSDAKKYGAGWVRTRIQNSTVLRWNTVRKKSLEITTRTAHLVVSQSMEPVISKATLKVVLDALGGPKGARFRADDCPF